MCTNGTHRKSVCVCVCVCVRELVNTHNIASCMEGSFVYAVILSRSFIIMLKIPLQIQG